MKRQVKRNKGKRRPPPGAYDMKPVLKTDSTGESSKVNRYDRFIDFLRNVKDSKFTGYIKINFSQGQIGRVEKFEEILKG